MFLRFYLYCLLFGFVIYAIIDFVKIRTMEVLTARANYELIEKTINLLERKYLLHQEGYLDGKFNELNEYSIYSVSIMGVFNLQKELPADKYAKILEGEIVIINDNTALKKIGGTNKVLSLNASQFGLSSRISEDRTIRYRVYINGMLWLALLIALFCYSWLNPIWCDVKKIRQKALLLSAGDLNARVEGASSAIFKPIASALDEMADKIQDATLMRRAMTTTMAHELRTPIARIRFHLHNYLEEKDAYNKEAIMNNIYNEINCVESLIDTALSYASIANYNKIFSPQKQYISTWLDEQIDAAIKGSKDIQFIKNYDSNLGWVYMDMNLMERVLSNLLGNAKKYTKSIVQVNVTRTEEILTFSIEDNGKGVAAEDIDQVFKPFYRGKGNKKLGIRGFGLGLTIVDKIVALHRGTIHVKTSELGGACFVVEIPCDYQHQ